MVEGSKTNQALLDLVRDKMAKAAKVSSQQAMMSLDGSEEVVATSSGFSPKPYYAKKVQGTG